MCLVQVFITLRQLDYREYLSKIYMFPVFGAIMFIVVYIIGKAMGNSVVTLIVQIITGMIIYGALAIGYLYYRKNDILLSTIDKLRSRLKQITSR